MFKIKKREALSIDVYIDYLCPYAHRAAVWLRAVQKDTGHRLAVNWRYFSLEQVNNKEGEGWKIWEQPDDYSSRGLWAFRAGEAARRQGEDLFLSFHFTLFDARHEQNRDIADVNALLELARNVGLDVDRFQKDLHDRALLSNLAQSHTFAAETLGVFGTPTIIFPGGKPVFLKMESLPPSSERLAVFDEIRSLAEKRQYVLEIKRP